MGTPKGNPEPAVVIVKKLRIRLVPVFRNLLPGVRILGGLRAENWTRSVAIFEIDGITDHHCRRGVAAKDRKLEDTRGCKGLPIGEILALPVGVRH